MDPARRRVRERQRFQVVPLIALFGVTSAPLFAEETVPDFQFDPVEYWAARILIWIVFLSLGVVGYALFKASRRQLTGVAGKGVLLVGVILLPSFSVATGMLLVFSRAERVEFCGSCHHAMATFVDDMTDPRSGGLAALHYRERYIPSNQCYECHTSYGLFGNAAAKFHGVGEVLRYYTGNYRSEITMWKPYRNGDCLKCHARSMTWLSVQAHTSEDAKLDMFEDRISCMDCHDSGHQTRTVTTERDS